MTKAELVLFELRKAGYARLNRAQYFMVTFDLSGSAGRQAVYARFRARLGALVGAENVVRAIKQVYFVKADFSSRDIREEMQRVLERQDSIIITRLQPGESFRLKVPGAGRAAKAFFAELEEDEGGEL